MRLFLFCSIFLLFIWGDWLLPITDPTECCYVLTAKEMLEMGDLISPRIYGKFWYDKPILFYWELIIAYTSFGFGEFTSRLFPAFFALSGISLTYFFSQKLYDRTIAIIASILLASSLEYWYLSHAIITDMTLFVAFSSVLISFFLGYRADNEKFYSISFAASGVAILTKGPIGFFLPGLIIFIFLIWQNDLKHLKKLLRLKNVFLLIGIVSVWYLPMFLIHGCDFLENFFGVHNFLRATAPEYPKSDVWYYYIVILFVGFFPWSFYWIPLVFKKILSEKKKLLVLETQEKFFIVWIVTVYIFFQFCATKYLTYTLPAMMPVAIFMAKQFVRHLRIFAVTVAVAVGFYLLSIYIIAIPICEDNSGRQEAQLISTFGDNICIISYGERYPGSIVLYTGKAVYRLEKESIRDALLPRKMNWTAKNVMPFMTFEELPEDRNILAVVDANKEKDFLINATGHWQLLKEFSRNDLARLFKTFSNAETISAQKTKSKIYFRKLSD